MEEITNRDVIVTECVTKVYSGNGVPVHALRGVDLTIQSGEFTALVGPSGSGKTTLLNIISGLDTPTEGKVWLSGKLLSRMSGNELWGVGVLGVLGVLGEETPMLLTPPCSHAPPCLTLANRRI